MTKGRMEAFSDGVFAVIITIMVLEMKSPQGSGLAALQPLLPVFLCYGLSFVYVGIYWNNHHHMLHAAEHVSGAALWANLHLLFWLSLIPFVTAWVDENYLVTAPVALYGVVLLMAAIAYYILARVLIRDNGAGSQLAKAFGEDIKGRNSIALYAVGIALSLWHAWLAVAIYVLVAIMWVIPDRRIEK